MASMVFFRRLAPLSAESGRFVLSILCSSACVSLWRIYSMFPAGISVWLFRAKDPRVRL